MLNEALIWWAERLASLLPAWLRGGSVRDTAVLTLSPGFAHMDLVIRRRGRDALPQRFAAGPDGMVALRQALGARPPPIALHLPAGAALEQTTILPFAAERDAGRVLAYEMDRLTPFRTEDLFWTFRITRRDRARRLLDIVVSLVPRTAISPVLKGLAEAGLRPGSLCAGRAVIGLAGSDVPSWRRRAEVGLAIACALLAVAAAVVPFVAQSREQSAIEGRIRALRPAADEVEALRRRSASLAAGVDVLAAQRATSGAVLEMLAALTVTLPDDTVLSDFAYRARVATLSGESAAAARLIPTLANDPVLRNTSFAAPVTRNETRRNEGFTIRTELSP